MSEVDPGIHEPGVESIADLPAIIRDHLEVAHSRTDKLVGIESTPLLDGQTIESFLNHGQVFRFYPKNPNFVVEPLNGPVDCNKTYYNFNLEEEFNPCEPLRKPKSLHSISLTPDGAMLFIGDERQIFGSHRPNFADTDSLSKPWLYWWADRAILLTDPSQVDGLRFRERTDDEHNNMYTQALGASVTGKVVTIQQAGN